MEPTDKTHVTFDDVIELHEALLDKCTDHVSIKVEHAGRFRFKITAISFDMHVSHFNVSVECDRSVAQWAVEIAKQINSPLASRPSQWCMA